MVHVVPLNVKPPQIVDWFTTNEALKHVYTFVRAEKSSLSCSTVLSVIKTITRDVLDDILKVGMRK